MEYRRQVNVFNAAKRAVLSLKIDPKTLQQANGLYARALVDSDLSIALLDKILVKIKS